MPFANASQERACWAQLKRDIEAGKIPRWDCPAWEAESGKIPHSGFPPNFTDLKIRKGPRGGSFIVYKGYKVYVSDTGFKKGFTMKVEGLKLTKSQCREWMKDRTVNPVTGRSIKAGGPTYTQFVEACKAYKL